MTVPTKAEIQATILNISETLLMISGLVDDDDDILGEGHDDELAMALDDGNEFDYDEDQDRVAEVLEYTSINWMLVAQFMMGDGSRGTYNQIPKSLDYFSTSLQSPDRYFRQMFRLGRDTFDELVARLNQDPIFHVPGRKPQRHVKYQLACFLIRYGLRGSDTLDVARKLSIGHGTVFIYCSRVSRALRRLGRQVLSFPSKERQDEIAVEIQAKTGLPGCIGSVDGSLIELTEEPIVNGHVYYTRKKFYGINIQATVDHERRFTSFELGWPGSVPDSKIGSLHPATVGLPGQQAQNPAHNEEDGDIDEDVDVGVPEYETDAYIKTAGQSKRQQLMDAVVPEEDYM
ncbi:hypothetical protein CVT24_012866 [Panaeolus cyanescens]|uniref:DDE Tnp4 domain-containing protein n=1 Tax=Panaeolus cyanescens TaxID=181874 RepID=A0A409WQW9_9AGAR|nr:hypothetical protein CVT24_012866 [Panaeolus cyanescens]